MAVNYPLPPWLHPQDTVQPFMQAQRLQAEMQMQQQRLQQQTMMAGIEAEVKREQAQREALLQQQRIEVSKAQQQQEAALKMQELQQAQQKIEQASQIAARKYAAMQAYQQRVQAGDDPLKAFMELGPSMGQSMGPEFAAQIRAKAAANKPPILPQFGTDPSGNPYMYNPATGAGRYSPRQHDQGLTANQILNAKLRMRADLLRQVPRDPDILATLSPAEKQAVEDAKNDAKTLGDEIKEMINKGATHPDLIPVERGGKKGFIHRDDLGAARDEVDDEGEPVYKLPDDIREPSTEETEGDEEYP